MEEAPKIRRKCPKCQSGTLTSRARRHFLVKTFFFWLPIKRYQCNVCDKKTYKFGNFKNEHRIAT